MKKLISLLVLTMAMTFITDSAQAKWRVKPAPQTRPAPQIKSASSQQDADTELAKIMQNPAEFSFSMIQGIPNSFNLRFLCKFWDCKARDFGPKDFLILTNLTPDKISGLDLIAQGGAQFCKVKKNLTTPGTTNLEGEVCSEGQQASQTTAGRSVSDSIFGNFDLYSTAGCKGDGSTGLVASLGPLGLQQKNNDYNLTLKGPNSCGGDAGNLNASSAPQGSNTVSNGNRFQKTVGNLQDKLCSRSAEQATRGEEGFADKKPAEELASSAPPLPNITSNILSSLYQDRQSARRQTLEGWANVFFQVRDSLKLYNDPEKDEEWRQFIIMKQQVDLAIIDMVAKQELDKCESCVDTAKIAEEWEQLIQKAIKKGTEKAKKTKTVPKKAGTKTSSNDTSDTFDDISDTSEEPSNTATPCDKDVSGMCGGRSHFADSLIRSLRTGKTLEDIENQRINPVRGGTQAGEEFPRINVCESIDTVDSFMIQKGFGGDTKGPGDNQKKFNRADQKKFMEQLKRGQALPKNNPRVVNPVPPGP